ncbi:MAG: 6-carboxytetrahydropterin synthase [Bryobacteraceae bacterium]
MKTTVTRLYRFSASHRLHLSQLSEDENTRLYGKCNNPFGHGHNYILEVTAAGPVDSETGQVVRPAELDSLVGNCVLSLFGDRNINLDIPRFRELVPTTENIATVISELLGESWDSYISGPARLRRVHVQETDRNGFEIWVPAMPAKFEKQRERAEVTL